MGRIFAYVAPAQGGEEQWDMASVPSLSGVLFPVMLILRGFLNVKLIILWSATIVDREV